MSKNGKPYLPDVASIVAAGIDPNTGLPYKLGSCEGAALKTNCEATMRVVDRQDALNRYVWYNLPNGLNGQLLETILYYKGKGCFFLNEPDRTFYFLPYTLSEGLDVYGRFRKVKPLPYRGSGDNKDDKLDPRDAWLTSKELKPVYGLDINGPQNLSDLYDRCVLLKDYSSGETEEIIPRAVLQAPLLDVMSRCIPYLKTALSNSTGIGGLVVPDDDSSWQVDNANKDCENAALSGKKWIGIQSKMEIQALTGSGAGNCETYLLALQGLDNYRMSMYGIDNGGLFQKKAHMLEAEQESNAGNIGLIMQDGLALRQRFCDTVNSMWGLGIWCEPAEEVLGVDRDGNGIIGADEPRETSPVQGGENNGGESNE